MYDSYTLPQLVERIHHLTTTLRYLKLSVPELYNGIFTTEVHNSNKLEGNTLSYDDTVALLNGELVQVANSQENDVNEILGYRKASELVISELRQHYSNPKLLTVEFIQDLHCQLPTT